jgi:hypothetical protein
MPKASTKKSLFGSRSDNQKSPTIPAKKTASILRVLFAYLRWDIHF